MEALLNRYRNLTVLVTVLLAQLFYLAYQIRTSHDERLIRVWAVTAVTPMAGIVEAVRHNTIGFLEDYFILLDVREQNRTLKGQNDQLRMENVYLRNQLATAQNARALTLFATETPSKTIAARVVGNSTVSSAKAVFIDRGSSSGFEKGMAVVTPEGIVGKIAAVYPLVSQVLLVTDPTFKVGIESQRRHVHGVLACGSGKCVVEQVANEEDVRIGEWFFTSGEDRIFPKGFPVGTVESAAAGQGTKEIHLKLSGAPGGVEEVLVVLHGVHQELPTEPPVETATATLPAPPPETKTESAAVAKPQTQADKIEQQYAEIGEKQGHVYGAIGSAVPDFNLKADGTPDPHLDGNVGKGKPAAPPSTQPNPTAVLGARGSKPPAPGEPPVTPAKDALDQQPALPLGAPRHKREAGVASTALQSSAAQQ
jgi:rod shape-determining protein MreC